MKAKLIDSTTITTNHYTIDYGNGVFCNIETQNDKIISHDFRNNNDLKLIVVKNIDEVVKYHWSKHLDILKSKKFRSLKSLEKFKDFDLLFYIGAGLDGEIRDRHGNYKASLIFLSDSFFSIWCNIKRKSDVDILKEKLKNCDIISNIKDYNIGYYNGGGDTITANMTISDELYNKFRLKNGGVDENFYFDILSNRIKDLRVPEYDEENNDECYCTC
jgi:hypothetical protein